jgi:hypothetical protein
MDGFVDNVTTWLNNRDQLHTEQETIQPSTRAKEIITKMETAAQWSEQLLYSIVGELELSKCFYYIIHWKFNNNGIARMAKNDELARTIQITQSRDNNPVTIECKESNTAHKTLGIMANPSMDPTAKLQRLMDKARHFKHQILQGTTGRYATMPSLKVHLQRKNSIQSRGNGNSPETTRRSTKHSQPNNTFAPRLQQTHACLSCLRPSKIRRHRND